MRSRLNIDPYQRSIDPYQYAAQRALLQFTHATNIYVRGKIMSQTAGNYSVQDKATMRRLGIAVTCMCIGALGLVALAIIVGNSFH